MGARGDSVANMALRMRVRIHSGRVQDGDGGGHHSDDDVELERQQWPMRPTANKRRKFLTMPF